VRALGHLETSSATLHTTALPAPLVFVVTLFPTLKFDMGRASYATTNRAVRVLGSTSTQRSGMNEPHED
jgi:hypothetical protein